MGLALWKKDGIGIAMKPCSLLGLRHGAWILEYPNPQSSAQRHSGNAETCCREGDGKFDRCRM